MSETEFNDYIDCDEHLECYGNLNENEILEEICQQTDDNDDDDESVEGSAPLPPTRNDALQALAVLRAFSKHKNIDLSNLDAWEEQFCDQSAENCVQKKISDFFK